MTLIDRVMARGYVKAYAVCLVSLLSLYVIIDLFTNLEDYGDARKDFAGVLKTIGLYYAYQMSLIFDRLCEAIVLLSAMFTVALAQRNNEMLPLLSAGVSMRRVVRPVLVCAFLTLALTVVNKELIMPPIGPNLLYERSDPSGEKDALVQGAYEPNGIHVEGKTADRRELVVRDFCCLLPESVAGTLTHLQAREAYYIAPGADGPYSGGWLLIGAQPAELPGWTNTAVLKVLDAGKYFLHTRVVDFDAVSRPRNWFQYASTLRLKEELSRPDSTRLASMAVLFHGRMTRPILGLLLVVLGLSVILRDQNRNVFIGTALCLVLFGVFFGAQFLCTHLGNNEYISPALSAWLPVLGFGPLAFVLFDAVHT